MTGTAASGAGVFGDLVGQDAVVAELRGAAAAASASCAVSRIPG